MSQTPNTSQTQTDLTKKLKELLERMSPWEKKPVVQTTHHVIELVKLPARQTKRASYPARLALQLRSTDSFRGIIIESATEAESLIMIIEKAKDKILSIAKALDQMRKVEEVEELW